MVNAQNIYELKPFLGCEYLIGGVLNDNLRDMNEDSSSKSCLQAEQILRIHEKRTGH